MDTLTVSFWKEGAEPAAAASAEARAEAVEKAVKVPFALFPRSFEPSGHVSLQPVPHTRTPRELAAIAAIVETSGPHDEACTMLSHVLVVNGNSENPRAIRCRPFCCCNCGHVEKEWIE